MIRDNTVTWDRGTITFSEGDGPVLPCAGIEVSEADSVVQLRPVAVQGTCTATRIVVPRHALRELVALLSRIEAESKNEVALDAW